MALGLGSKEGPGAIWRRPPKVGLKIASIVQWQSRLQVEWACKGQPGVSARRLLWVHKNRRSAHKGLGCFDGLGFGVWWPWV